MKSNFNGLSKYWLMRAFMLAALFLVTTTLQAQSVISPDGYAGSAGTTGGGNASPITVTSGSAFQSAVSNNNPAVIIVDGLLSIGNISIGSNKTIIGANTSSGLTGGTVRLQGTNYILQNLTFGPASGDVLEVSGATKVFITKCSFHDSTDELCSIVRAADYVTVSWSKFYFDNPDSHSFAHLIGNSDGATDDDGKLHVTLHHNWYAQGVRGRMPRVRFGYVHIYNNYYNSNSTGYCIGAGFKCHIRVENSYFQNVNNAWADYGAPSSGGVIGWNNLVLDGTSQPTFMSNSYPVFSLPYSFNLTPVNDVQSIVTAGAGNVGTVSPVDNYTLTTTVTGQGSVSPNGGTYASGTVVTLIATPANGYTFNSWGGAASGTSTSTTVTMNANKSVTANFSEIPVGNQIIMEENALGFCAVDGSIDSNHAGFTGSGFVNTDNAVGTAVEWKVTAAASDTYALQWRYAHDGETDDRPGSLLVNGAVVNNVSFPASGSWTSWVQSSLVYVTLNSGANTIRLISTTSNGLGNIDRMAIIGDNLSATSCDDVVNPVFTLSTSANNGTISLSPNGGPYAEGTVVTLTATPASGYTFTSWSGDLSGNSNPVTLTMNTNKSVSANFSQSSTFEVLTIQENEAGFCSVQGSVDNDNDGFTGSGFANTTNSNGNGITWSVNVPSAGTYSIKWRYANGEPTNRTGQLTANGNTLASSIDMPTTDNWTTWVETPALNINLQAGTTLLRLQATTTDGLANIDFMTISGLSLSTGACSGARTSMPDALVETAEDQGILFYPVPVNASLTIHFGTTLTEPTDVYLLDTTGRVIKATKAKGSTHAVDLSDLPGGAYFIRVSGQDLNVVKHIIKQ